jgi:hypothetical protein
MSAAATRARQPDARTRPADGLSQARELLAHAEDVRALVDAAGRALEGRLVVGCFRTGAPFVLSVGAVRAVATRR